MAVITARYFDYQLDQNLVLTGDEWMRPLPFLGDWQHIRVGVLCAIQPLYGNATIPEAMFTVGLCSGRSGVSNMFCNNFVGVSLTNSPAGGNAHGWTYTNNSGNPYYSNATAGQAFRRFNNPVTGSAYVLGAAVIPGATSALIPVAGRGIRKRRYPFVLDIQRSPTTGVYTFTIYYPGDTTADYRIDHLMEAVDQWGTPLVAGQTWSSQNTTLSAAEDTGTLDTVSVYWSSTLAGLEVYGICVNLLSDLGTPQLSYPAAAGAYDLLAPAGSVAQQNAVSTLGTAFVAGYGTYAPVFAQVGTGTATGLATGFNWAAPYFFEGTANLVGQNIYIGTTGQFQIGAAGTTLGVDDPFGQYPAGTVFPGTLAGGTNWTSPWVWTGTVGGTWSNFGSLWDSSAFYGTVFGPDDSMAQYGLGTVTSMSGGTGWAGAFTPVYYAGTTFPPMMTSLLSFGAAGTSTGTLYFMSTASGLPWDNFESYASGTISILTAGTGWGSYGTIYAP